jgi:hypothetical protein
MSVTVDRSESESRREHFEKRFTLLPEIVTGSVFSWDHELIEATSTYKSLGNLFFTDVDNEPDPKDYYQRLIYKFADIGFTDNDVYIYKIIDTYRKGDFWNKLTLEGKKEIISETLDEVPEIQTECVDKLFNYQPESVDDIAEINAEELKELIQKQHDDNRIPDLSKLLPEDHFLNLYPSWMSGLTDTYYEFQICGAFWELSAATQGKVKIELKQGTIKPNVWFMLIGRSTTSRKSTAVNNTSSVWAAVSEEILNNDDFSLEGYLEALSRDPVSNFIRDEAAGLFAKYKQKYNDGIFDAECTLFDGKNYKKTLASKGKKDPQTFEIIDPFITHFYATTPDRLQGSLTLDDFASGYGIRFLYAYPSYPKARKDIDLEDEEDTKKWGEVVTRLRTMYNNFKKVDYINFKITQEALSTYNSIVAELENITDNISDGLLDSAAGRAQDYILKLAMLIEIGKTEQSFEITEESVQLASLLVINFFLPCFTSIRDLLFEDVKHNMIEKMLKIFRNKNGTCTKSELITLGHFLKSERDSALEALQECGAVEEKIIAETKQHIYILKNDNKPKIKIDSLAERFQNLEFKSVSRFSKLSSLTPDKECSAKFAKNDQIKSKDNGKSFSQVVKNRIVGSCLIAKNAKDAKDAKFDDENQYECDYGENIQDLSFNSVVVTDKEAAKWLEESGF